MQGFRRMNSESLLGFPRAAALILVAAVDSAIVPELAHAQWAFTDITTAAGFNYSHGYLANPSGAKTYSGGVACGDYNKDGWVDLFVVRGDIGPNLLFRNLGNGTFQEVGASAGVAQSGQRSNAPCFADMNGDGWLDLFMGGIENTEITVFKNLGNGTFQNVTASTGIVYTADTFSPAFGDYDRDGDLDIFLAHYGSVQTTGNLWKNNGNFTFTDADVQAGITVVGGLFQYGLTPNWADINNDRWPDMLLVSDFNTSQVFLNDGDGTFTETTSPVLTDEDGMGGAVGDYDNDGDLDWFVSSVWGTGSNKESEVATRLGISGNRLYRNTGNGTFQDVTAAAGVLNGGWAWGSSFQDFNNDGHLDLVLTNGLETNQQWQADSSRLWVSNTNGTFTEMSRSLGLIDTKNGRGVACFDFDRDGDLDIFTANNGQPPTFFRNDGLTNRWLNVRLLGTPPNTEAAGARVYVSPTGGPLTYMREIRVGNNYVSQDPAVAHFGVQNLTSVFQVRVEWPDGTIDTYNNVSTNRTLVVDQAGIVAVEPPADGTQGEGAIWLVEVSPNPFAGSAAFRFSIPVAAPVRLEIFDASGRAVRTLVDEVRPSGAHEAHWDGRDSNQEPVAPGVYLYRLESAGESARGKISVVR